MNEKSIYKKALILAVPMMIQNGITNMVGLIDNVMVGSLGTEAMTAVSIIGQLIFVFNLAVFGGLSGAGIYGAQYYGNKDMEGFKNAFRMKQLIGLFCIICGIAVFITGDEFLINRYLQGESNTVNPEITMNYAKQYLSIMLLGIPPFVLTQIYATSLRESGDSIKPMTAGIISVFVDIVFNWLLIYGNLGMPRLGVKGAAIATVFARMVECAVLIIWSLARKEKHIFLQGIYSKFLVPADFALNIIKKGLPIFFNEFLWAGSIAMLTQCYSKRSLEIVAGLNISNALCNLLNVVFVALGSAVGIIIGQTLGASEYEKAKKDSFRLMKFAGGICIILTVILVLFSGIFPEFYDTTAEIKEYGKNFIIITALFFPLQGVLNALYFTLRSGGQTFITFLFDSVYSWVVTVSLAYILCNFTAIPVLGIYAIVQSADIIKFVIGYILIRKGIWISNIVSE